MYCSICGGPAVTTCVACERNICAGHRRRWLGITLCTRCHGRTAPAWAVLLAIGLVVAFIVFLVLKWRSDTVPRTARAEPAAYVLRQG